MEQTSESDCRQLKRYGVRKSAVNWRLIGLIDILPKFKNSIK